MRKFKDLNVEESDIRVPNGRTSPESLMEFLLKIANGHYIYEIPHRCYEVEFDLLEYAEFIGKPIKCLRKDRFFKQVEKDLSIISRWAFEYHKYQSHVLFRILEGYVGSLSEYKFRVTFTATFTKIFI